MNEPENQSMALTADVYFLIQRFLSSGPLTKTLQVLNEELEAHKIFSKRIDWEGNQHERTVEDMENQFPNIRPDYLMQLCYEATSKSNDTLSSFLRFKPKQLHKNKSFNQLCNYIIRSHHVPIHNINCSFNLVNALRGREVSGPFSQQRAITPRIYNSLQMQRVTLGHLSAVYCLLFDHSGNYILTGADDLLIKLWSAHTGRLIAAFRGASSEITDIAVNPENTLVAAGSIDRILRVWNLQTGAPVAVLTGHTGMITSVNFCPTACWGVRYLITTSSDGSVAFWTYTHESLNKVEFRSTPTLYQEKLRPGQAQMICSSFSTGGTFLAAGSADHHVRVYYMKGDDGPQRILETEAHTDRVDSIQWAHSGLRFVSGSKDGTAIIWWFERQQWKTTYLHMSATLNNCSSNSAADDPKKLKVTMVTWNRNDNFVITSDGDNSLKVWKSSTGELVKILTSHTDEIYVLESHPHHDNIILSAGHDGQLFVWDISNGDIIFRYLNTIESQGYGAIFDVKWNPDGTLIAATDSHGHLITFGFGSQNPFYEQLPKELFFHTDYRPLVRDVNNHYVLDEQTQIPPHLMPPPFLVDIDGNPYPPMLQKLVPGREHCNAEQLVPNIVIGNEGTQEVIQDIPDIARLVPNAQHAEENHHNFGVEFEPEDFGEYNPVVPDGGVNAVRNPNVLRGANPTVNGRRPRDLERIRQSTGDWQSDPNMEWKTNVLVPSLNKALFEKAKALREVMKDAEIEEYQKQLRHRPHMICTSTSNNIKTRERDKKKKNNYRTRSSRVILKSEPSESSDNDDDQHSESSGYSDWMADEGRNLQSSKRRKRRQVSHSDEEEDEDEDDDDDDDDEGAEDDEKPSTSRRNNHQADKNEVPAKPTATPSTSSGVPRYSKKKVSEKYRLSEWLSETRPRKSPYYPQLGDEIMYFVQGHQLYLEAVRVKDIYEISTKDLPWNNTTLNNHEYVKVLSINYEIKPPRLCCLELSILDEDGQMTGNSFTVKYHDMPDVLDFFVLRQTYITSVSRNWAPDDKFRCMIDDEWWIGQIVDNTPSSDHFPDSPFMCYEIKWYNGERERMSPWDLEPIDAERMPDDESQALPVLEAELNAILYKPVVDDWPDNNRDVICKYILTGLMNVMELAIAEPFLVPVDISVYPTYAFIIEYPIDLSTIKARFENNFYRRLTAAEFDIRYLATNAAKFNQRHSIIVKNARIVTDLCVRIIRNCTGVLDVATIYHQLVDSYDSSNTDDEMEILPSSSRALKKQQPDKSQKADLEWKSEAKKLIDVMLNCEDSLPFRLPVDLIKYPDYNILVETPMDLGTVQENLQNNTYDLPMNFCTDVRLIFKNSRKYNTNKRSRIYVMTVRLSAMFEEHMKKIICNWKETKRQEKYKQISKNNSESSAVSSSSSSSEDEVSEEDLKVDVENNSDDSDDLPLGSLRKTRKAPVVTNNGVNNRLKNSDSEDSYIPEAATSCRVTRKRGAPPLSTDDDQGNKSSEDKSSEEESDSDKGRRKTRSTRTRKQVKTKDKRRKYSASEDSDSGVRTRRKRRRCVTESGSDDDDDSDSKSNSDDDDEDEDLQGDSDNCFTTVSSRGRVRKLTPRAQALMKKDKKII